MERKLRLRGSYMAVAIIMVFSLLVGCATTTNNNGAQNDSSNGSGDAGEKVTLRMSWWGGESRHKATLDAIKLYQQENPHVEIIGEYGGWDGYLEKLTTQLAAGTAPDIMQTDYQFLGQFSRQSDLFVDLDSEEALDISGFDAKFLEGLKTPSGILIGLPTGIAAYTFYLNKTLADQAGIDYSDQLTWDRLLEEGRKLHEQNSNMYLLHMTIDYDLKDYIFIPYLLNLTGKKFITDDYQLGFDRDALIQTFEYINNLYDNGVIQPAADTANLKTGQHYQNPKWLNNEIVGILSLNSFYSTISTSIPDSEVIVVDFPATQGVENTGVVVRPTNMWSVNNNSEHREEALKFLNWLMNDTEAVRTLSLERSIPAVNSARETLLDDGLIDEHFNYSVQYATEHQGMPESFASLDKEVQLIVNNVLAGLAYKEYTPEMAADQMTEQLTSKLKDLNR